MASADFSFFLLPPEIRVQIYSHLLIFLSKSRAGLVRKGKALLIVGFASQDDKEDARPGDGTKSKLELVVYPDGFRELENRLGLSAQLLRTCKLINSEGAPILYGQHRFRASLCDDPSPRRGRQTRAQVLVAFFDRVGPRNTSCVTDLQFFFPRCMMDIHHSDRDQVKLLSGTCGARIGGSIKSIRTTIPIDSYMRDFLASPGNAPLEVFKRVYRFLKEFFPEVEVLSTGGRMLAARGDMEYVGSIREIGWTLDL